MNLTPEQLTHAAEVLKYLRVGDIITSTRCGGMLAEHKYLGLGGGECLRGTPTLETVRMVSRYGDRCHGETRNADDLHPAFVTHINRVPVGVIKHLAQPWPMNRDTTSVNQSPSEIGPPGEGWFKRDDPWPRIGVAVEGAWARPNRQYACSYVILARLRGGTASWRDTEGNAVPFGPQWWRP